MIRKNPRHKKAFNWFEENVIPIIGNPSIMILIWLIVIATILLTKL